MGTVVDFWRLIQAVDCTGKFGLCCVYLNKMNKMYLCSDGNSVGVKLKQGKWPYRVRYSDSCNERRYSFAVEKGFLLSYISVKDVMKYIIKDVGPAWCQSSARKLTLCLIKQLMAAGFALCPHAGHSQSTGGNRNTSKETNDHPFFFHICTQILSEKN